jgi:putative transposase
MGRCHYDTDLSDAEWAIFEETMLAIRKSPRGRKPSIPRREVVNGILYRLRTGCQWRNLPHDFPAWGTVYRTYRRWILNGYWEQIHDALCREVRVQNGRDPEPSALIIDSQSVKADAWAENTGYDAGKKIKGIKRHVIVDVLGLLIGIIVHSAAIQDRDGAKVLLLRVQDRLPRVKLIWADGGYAGKLVKWVEDETPWTLEIVKRSDLHTFKVLPKRWIVERTFGWLMFWRSMNRHHERKYDTAENIMRIAMTKNMLRYLTLGKRENKAA